jgi:ribonuclease P protein component
LSTVRHTFSKELRIRKKAEFDAVFARRQRSFQGPLGVYVVPNNLPHSRLGISMSRRVGIAARRNRIKRLLRESFRLQQHELPAGYDIVVVPKPHQPLELADYLGLFRDAVRAACAKTRPEA